MTAGPIASPTSTQRSTNAQATPTASTSSETSADAWASSLLVSCGADLKDLTSMEDWAGAAYGYLVDGTSDVALFPCTAVEFRVDEDSKVMLMTIGDDVVEELSIDGDCVRLHATKSRDDRAAFISPNNVLSGLGGILGWRALLLAAADTFLLYADSEYQDDSESVSFRDQAAAYHDALVSLV